MPPPHPYRNEEELKSLFLLPLLRSLGVPSEEIELERSFSFKVGRRQLSESVEAQLTEARPRLDVLVKRRNRNAFVLEVKAPELDLTEEDALQAISYARLVHPIAPFAILSNGSTTQVFDVVTREQVTREALASGLKGDLAVVLPGSDDFDALECFLRINPENLGRFADEQVSASLRSLVGSPSDLAKKYVPELHVARAQVEREVDRFQRDPHPVMALVGDSGIGKTSTMCHLAAAVLPTRAPALFFRASELGTSLLEHLAGEFAWTFADEHSPLKLVRRLSTIAQSTGLFVLIDGLDEWTAPGPQQQLGSLVRHLSGTAIKVIVSCKPSAWENFLSQRGTATDLSDAVMRSDHDVPGVQLANLTDEEFWQAMGHYRAAYGFNGPWDPTLLEEARRNPFFMRIAFEVARSERLQELRESSHVLFDRYFQALLRKTSDPEITRRVTITAARLLDTQNAGQVSMDDFHGALGLRPTDPVPTEPFSAGILETLGAEDDTRMEFAFEGLRSFVVASHVRQWPRMMPEDFRLEVEAVPRDGIAGEALLAYYRWAADAHKRVLDHGCMSPALAVLGRYRSIVATHLPLVARWLPPGNLERAGMVLEADLESGEPLSVGLRLRGPADPEVLIVPSAERRWDSHTVQRFGAGGLAYPLGVDWLHEPNVGAALLSSNVGRLVEEVVDKGRLNEASSPDLARELLAAIVIAKPGLLGEPNRAGRRETLPLPAGRIGYWLRFQQHWARLEDELIDAKVRAGAVPVTREGSRISYSRPHLTDSQRSELWVQCERAALSGAAPSGRGRIVPLDDIAARVMAAVEDVGEQAIIAGALFPEAREYSRAAARLTVGADELPYQQRFITAFLSAYRGLVEANFPTIRERFQLYQWMPCLIRLAVGPASPGLAFPTRCTVIEVSQPVGHSLATSRVVAVELEQMHRAAWRDPFVFEGERYQPVWWRSGLNDYLGGSPWRRPDLGQMASLTVLRDFTYQWIKGELKTPLDALAQLCDLPPFR
jgi:hypothetical protein